MILGVASLASSASAATYYVSTSGSNGNSGSSTSPWRTLSYATGRAAAGDTILVGSGTYTETSNLLVQRANLTIRAADPANKPLLDFNTPSWQSGYSVWIDQPNVTWDGVHVRNAGGWGLWFWGANGFKLKNCRIDYSYSGAVRMDNVNGGEIANCELTQNGQCNADRTGTIDWPHAIIGWNADNIRVTANNIYRNHGEGVGPYLGCSGWYIGYNTVYDNFSVNIYVDTEEGWCTVENNLSYYTGYTIGTDPRNKPAGIRVANEASDFGLNSDDGIVEGVVIQNNMVLNCNGGIQAYPYGSKGTFKLRNSNIQHNTIAGTQNNTPGVWITGYHSGVQLKNNIVRNTGQGGLWLSRGVTSRSNYTGDPQFVTGIGNDPNGYKIKSTSLCRDTGSSSSVNYDYFWGARPFGRARDIGAHEFR